MWEEPKIEGQREGISALLFHDTVIAVYEHILEAESLNPSGKGPRKRKRKSILATFGLGVFMIALLTLIVAGWHGGNAPWVVHHKPTSVIAKNRVSKRQKYRKSKSVAPESHLVNSQRPRPTEAKTTRMMVKTMKPISDDDIYGSIMGIIEPDLCTDDPSAIHVKFKNDSPGEAKRRMARYAEAFRLYDLCFEEYHRTIGQPAVQTARIHALIQQERRRQ